jgi:DNA-binding GntR family transcriptional regulator
VSRTPVHEALVLLASEGLVDVIPRKGTFVSELTVRDVAETMEVRRALELLACETALQHAQPGDIIALSRLIDDMEKLVSENSEDNHDVVKAHYEKNMEFHQRLVALSKNRLLTDMYQGLNAHLKIARAHIKAEKWKMRLPQERKEHQMIVKALEAKDLTQLRVALDAHLRRSKDSLIEDLSEKEVEPP